MQKLTSWPVPTPREDTCKLANGGPRPDWQRKGDWLHYHRLPRTLWKIDVQLFSQSGLPLLHGVWGRKTVLRSGYWSPIQVSDGLWGAKRATWRGWSLCATV